MAYAARLSIDLGYEGFIAFDAKTKLIEHYTRSLKARQVGRTQRMVIYPADAQLLMKHYFGEENDARNA